MEYTSGLPLSKRTYTEKRRLSVPVIALAFCSPFVSIAHALDVTTAIGVLTSNKPMLYPTIELHKGDAVSQVKCLKLYQDELEAIQTVASAQMPHATTILVPFLNYPADGFDPVIDQSRLPARLENIKKEWPVFSAILTTPNASKDLADYCLDRGNSVRLKIAAFIVLRYVNPVDFNNIAIAFQKQFDHSPPRIKQYLASIVDGKATFNGVPPIEDPNR